MFAPLLLDLFFSSSSLFNVVTFRADLILYLVSEQINNWCLKDEFLPLEYVFFPTNTIRSGNIREREFFYSYQSV